MQTITNDLFAMGDWIAFIIWGIAIILAVVSIVLVFKSRTEKEKTDTANDSINDNNEKVNSITENDTLSENKELTPTPNCKKIIFYCGIILGLISILFFISGFFILGYVNSVQKNTAEINKKIQETNTTSTSTTENTTKKTKEADEDVYYMGILPLQNPSTMLERFSGIENYLKEKTGLNIKLKLYPTSGSVGGYTAVVKDITSGEIQFAYLAPVTIAQAHENGPVIPFACAQKSGSPVYYGHIVVKKDSPYKSIEDLEGKAVCGTSASSTSGNLMPSAMLLEKGIDKTTYFNPFEFLGSHDKAAEAVLAGTMEAGFINEATFDKYKEKESGLRSVWRHEAVPEFPFCVNTEEVDAETLAKVKNALLTMHETDLEGVKAVEPKYDKWVEINWENYSDIKNAVEKVHGEIFYDLENWTGK